MSKRAPPAMQPLASAAPWLECGRGARPPALPATPLTCMHPRRQRHLTVAAVAAALLLGVLLATLACLLLVVLLVAGQGPRGGGQALCRGGRVRGWVLARLEGCRSCALPCAMVSAGAVGWCAGSLQGGFVHQGAAGSRAAQAQSGGTTTWAWPCRRSPPHFRVHQAHEHPKQQVHARTHACTHTHAHAHAHTCNTRSRRSQHAPPPLASCTMMGKERSTSGARPWFCAAPRSAPPVPAPLLRPCCRACCEGRGGTQDRCGGAEARRVGVEEHKPIGWVWRSGSQCLTMRWQVAGREWGSGRSSPQQGTSASAPVGPHRTSHWLLAPGCKHRPCTRGVQPLLPRS